MVLNIYRTKPKSEKKVKYLLVEKTKFLASQVTTEIVKNFRNFVRELKCRNQNNKNKLMLN